jgi:hypothetical protein
VQRLRIQRSAKGTPDLQRPRRYFGWLAAWTFSSIYDCPWTLYWNLPLLTKKGTIQYEKPEIRKNPQETLALFAGKFRDNRKTPSPF